MKLYEVTVEEYDEDEDDYDDFVVTVLGESKEAVLQVYQREYLVDSIRVKESTEGFDPATVFIDYTIIDGELVDGDEGRQAFYEAFYAQERWKRNLWLPGIPKEPPQSSGSNSR